MALLDLILLLRIGLLQRTEAVVDLDVLPALTSHLLLQRIRRRRLHQSLQVAALLDLRLLSRISVLQRTEAVVDLNVLTALASDLLLQRLRRRGLQERFQVTAALDFLLLPGVCALQNTEAIVDLNILAALARNELLQRLRRGALKLHESLQVMAFLDLILLLRISLLQRTESIVDLDVLPALPSHLLLQRLRRRRLHLHQSLQVAALLDPGLLGRISVLQCTEAVVDLNILPALASHLLLQRLRRRRLQEGLQVRAVLDALFLLRIVGLQGSEAVMDLDVLPPLASHHSLDVAG